MSVGFKKGDYVVFEPGFAHVRFKSGDLLRIEGDSETRGGYILECLRVSDGAPGAVIACKLRPAKPHEIPEYVVWSEFLVGDVVLVVDEADKPEFRRQVEACGIHAHPTLFDRIDRFYTEGKFLIGEFHETLYRRKFKFTPAQAAKALPYSQKVIITTDGRTTTAKLIQGKQMICEAKATCAPGDTFNFIQGALLAIFRIAYGAKANPILTSDVRSFSVELDDLAARYRKLVNP